jgi:hypothetical protein
MNKKTGFFIDFDEAALGKYNMRRHGSDTTARTRRSEDRSEVRSRERAEDDEPRNEEFIGLHHFPTIQTRL